MRVRLKQGLNLKLGLDLKLGLALLLIGYLAAFSQLSQARSNTSQSSLSQTLGLSNTVSKEAIQRIISLSPNTTELAFSAGLGDKLVGVSELSDHPKQAQAIERIANYKGINLERIIELRPDLILASEQNSAHQLKALRQLNVPIYTIRIQRLEDIAYTVEQLSQLSSDPTQSQQQVAGFRQQLEALKNQVKRTKEHSNGSKDTSKNQWRYFYQISSEPIYSVSPPNWPTSLFEMCGGVSIISDTSIPYPIINIETLITRDPQIVFTSKRTNFLSLSPQQAIQTISAVKNNRIIELDSDLISRPTLRSLQVANTICQAFSPSR